MRPLNPDISTWTKLKTQVHNSPLTAAEVSQRSKIPWVRFSNAQTGKLILTPLEYERVAKVLGLHPLDLFGFNDPDLQVISVEDHKERNARMRKERKAIANLRESDPELYNKIVYGGKANAEVSNGSGG